MNYRMILRVLGMILLCIAALMLLPLITGLCFGEDISNFIKTIAITAGAGLAMLCAKPKNTRLIARDGYVIVGIGWILISLLGALPFYFSGSIPCYVDAVFETVSGFTTTGSSIIPNVELLPRSDLFWRSFTHWIGGMGVLVFVMAVLPMGGDHSMHILRAEVPGPTVGKLVPRARKTSLILYLIYIAMTIIMVVFLMAGGMSFYEALLHAFATAGTGGFSTRAASIASFNSAYIEIVCAVFMLLFSINFNLYFLLLLKRFKDAFFNEELLWFIGIVSVSTLLIALGIRNDYGFVTALRYAFFNVAAIISTTGFCTVDYVLWPVVTQWILVLMMFCGACAGSTGGGIKLSRVLILFKTAFAEIRQSARPRSVNRVQLDGKRVDGGTIHTIGVFFFLYIAILLGCAFVVSLDGFDITTNFSAALTCISNVGPGMSLIGPSGNFAIFSASSKLVLSLTMLIGRLEIFPILLLFSRHTWKN